jgi:L-serine deaminase
MYIAVVQPKSKTIRIKIISVSSGFAMWHSTNTMVIIIINNFIGMTCTGIAKVLSKSAVKSTVYLIGQEQML